ncbi:MAG: hypothetical protein R3F20_02660 [Planctomycetota bacterium]
MRDATLRPLVLVLFALFLTGVPWSKAAAQGVPIGFEERFALAADRAAVLDELIPGTDDYYFYRCLERQHADALDEVPALLEAWTEKHGRTSRVVEIENRQALLGFARDPDATYAFLRERLGLGFDQQRRIEGAKADLATALDPALVSTTRFRERALALHPNSLDGFRGAGLRAMADARLDEVLLTNLLARLDRPDLPNLPALVVRQLEWKRSTGFGSLGIHARLTLDQLEECAALRPALLGDANFVGQMIQRLAPRESEDVTRDDAALTRYLDRLGDLADRLTPAFNSFKAQVLHHRLSLDRRLGLHDRDRLVAYLRLPRQTRYVRPEFLPRRPRDGEMVDPNARFSPLLAGVGDDEPLVRAALAHFLVDQDDVRPFSEFVDATYLKRLQAETKILAGRDDVERWSAMMDDPAAFEALRERVSLDFAATNRRYYGPEDAVTLDLDVKNVRTLLVKVYEINTVNYYADLGQEVDAGIEIEGLVPSEERSLSYDESPFRLVRRRFEFPGLDRAGVFVVEFIGNGISSRAVVCKGRLRHRVTTGPAGHVFRVYDEAGRHLKDGSVRLRGREFFADENGDIAVPYSTSPGEKSIVLRQGRRATLARFRHLGEDYALESGVLLDREDLRGEGVARLVLRPLLTLNGEPLALGALEDLVLSIATWQRNGVPSTLERRDLVLAPGRDLVQEIRVPRDLAALTVSLRARVKSLTTGRKLDLTADVHKFRINDIEGTDLTRAPLLGRDAQGWFLDVLGKDGEPVADLPVTFTLVHRDYRDPVTVPLKTAADGRIRLGALAGITAVGASGLPDGYGAWSTDAPGRSRAVTLNAVAGETVRLPFTGRLARGEVSLIERRGSANFADRYDRLALKDGILELRDLPAGDYQLDLDREGSSISVRVVAGETREGWIVDDTHMFELRGRDELGITALRIDGGDLVVELANAGALARVHVFDSRFAAAFDPAVDFAVSPAPDPGQESSEAVESLHASGRVIGEEHRYILDRRYAAKFPGNMLRRPGVLLNPWALETTNSAIGLGGGAGGKFGGRRGGTRRSRAGRGARNQSVAVAPGGFADLDFLPGSGRLLANLEPGPDGTIRIPLADLGAGSLLHVVAAKGRQTVYRTLAREGSPLEPAPRRLLAALDAGRHFAESRGIDFLATGQSATIATTDGAEVETFDSLADVFRLYRSLNPDASLADFDFLLEWPTMDEARKRALYSQNACHELHFFLYRKDRDFFDRVVAPYLANKADRTFLDRWLLEEDLERYVEPRAFSRLNVVERILLARRLGASAGDVARHLRELWELRPIDLHRDEFLFGSALFSHDLGADKDAKPLGGGGGAGGAFDRRRAGLELGLAPNAAPAPGEKANRQGEGPERSANDEPAMDAEAEELVEEFEDEDRLEDARKSLESLKERAKAQSLYRAPETTQRYAENNYHHLPITSQGPDLVTINGFWRDFAAAPADAPFHSNRFAEASGNFTEMMFALSVLDLPFTAAEHAVTREDRAVKIEAASPLLLVRRELRETELETSASPILVSQSYFRVGDESIWVGNERRDKLVSGEFLIGTPYGCRVVVTNPTSSPRTLELLLQIPAGAIPIRSGVETRGTTLRIDAYGTQTTEYFLLPRVGGFAHFPVHVSEEGRSIAVAASAPMSAVAELSEVDRDSWPTCPRTARRRRWWPHSTARTSSDSIWSRIAPFGDPGDRAVFETVIGTLRRRLRLRRHRLVLRDPSPRSDATREYLAGVEPFRIACGPWLRTPIARIDPVERNLYERIEFHPLFNGRAHRFGRQREILDQDVAAQYLGLMRILCYHPRLDDADRLAGRLPAPAGPDRGVPRALRPDRRREPRLQDPVRLPPGLSRLLQRGPRARAVDRRGVPGSSRRPVARALPRCPQPARRGGRAARRPQRRGGPDAVADGRRRPPALADARGGVPPGHHRLREPRRL